jgi:hypothetical protein
VFKYSEEKQKVSIIMIKVKGKFITVLNNVLKHYAMKAYGGVEV